MLCSNGQNKTKFADFQQQFDGFFCIYFISVIYDHTKGITIPEKTMALSDKSRYSRFFRNLKESLCMSDIKFP